MLNPLKKILFESNKVSMQEPTFQIFDIKIKLKFNFNSYTDTIYCTISNLRALKVPKMT